MGSLNAAMFKEDKLFFHTPNWNEFWRLIFWLFFNNRRPFLAYKWKVLQSSLPINVTTETGEIEFRSDCLNRRDKMFNDVAIYSFVISKIATFLVGLVIDRSEFWEDFSLVLFIDLAYLLAVVYLHQCPCLDIFFLRCQSNIPFYYGYLVHS